MKSSLEDSISELLVALLGVPKVSDWATAYATEYQNNVRGVKEFGWTAYKVTWEEKKTLAEQCVQRADEILNLAQILLQTGPISRYKKNSELLELSSITRRRIITFECAEEEFGMYMQGTGDISELESLYAERGLVWQFT